MSIKYRIGCCSVCKQERLIVKRKPSGDLCIGCNKKRLSSVSPPKKTPPKTRKATGEKVLFEVISKTRPHVSFITKRPLSGEPKTWWFAHVLPKSTYPKFRLYDKNIVLLTAEQHRDWDFGGRAELIMDPRWDKMFSLEAELKEEYISLHGR